METMWIKNRQLERALARNEAYWRGELEEYPLLWITSPTTRPPKSIPKPAREADQWLNPQYVIESGEDRLARTYYVADTLPVLMPWLGPNQVAAWLGGDLQFQIEEHWTSWVNPFVEDWGEYPELRIDPENKWWRNYLDQVRLSAEAGRGKWVTAYPDLHTGIDALSAVRGMDRLCLDLMEHPEPIRRLMPQMTELFRFIVDTVESLVSPANQGTSNWTMGWSASRFLCIGQNDFTYLIGPEMFREFVLEDTIQTIRYAERSLYHLDGPGALRHLPMLLSLPELNAIQWVPGPNPDVGPWLTMLRRIQEAGKSVTVCPTNPDNVLRCCRELDIRRLFFWVNDIETPDEADAFVKEVKRVCAERRPPMIRT